VTRYDPVGPEAAFASTAGGWGVGVVIGEVIGDGEGGVGVDVSHPIIRHTRMVLRTVLHSCRMDRMTYPFSLGGIARPKSLNERDGVQSPQSIGAGTHGVLKDRQMQGKRFRKFL
jgi:hypothetical protein